MKIQIYIPIENAIEGILDPDNFTTYDPENSHYVQVSISVDEFTTLWDKATIKSSQLETQDYTYSEFKAKFYDNNGIMHFGQEILSEKDKYHIFQSNRKKKDE